MQDWDAFQSVLPEPRAAAMHAATRAISGGPVYTSDRPGAHDRALLRSLAFPDGTVPRYALTSSFASLPSHLSAKDVHARLAQCCGRSSRTPSSRPASRCLTLVTAVKANNITLH